MKENLDAAVTDAGALLDHDGRLRPDQTKASCIFVGQMKGKAKCNVIQDLGIMLHASQDFYSHTNWVDQPASDQPIGPENPPRPQQARPRRLHRPAPRQPDPAGPDFRLLREAPRAAALQLRPRRRICAASSTWWSTRTTAPSTPSSAGGTTLRGRHDDNFAHAIDAAIDDTRDKWLTFRQRLTQAYGRNKDRCPYRLRHQP